MRFRSLEIRIVIVFLVLILSVQVAGFLAIQSSIYKNARASIREELDVGERVFQRLLEQNAEKLTADARVLTKDYGFLSAIGTDGADDRETIASALSNLGDRVGAKMTLLVGPDRQIKAATTTNSMPSLQKSILLLVDKAEQTGSANGIGIVDNHPYQIVVVPVKAPVVIGWVAMAFPIDQTLAAKMGALFSLQVSVLTKDNNGDWNADASTLSAASAASLAQQMDELPENGSLPDTEFSARIVKLSPDSMQTAVVVLQRSINEAIEPYQRLRLTLIALTVIGILLAVVGSFLTAKHIAAPLQQLAETAKRLGAGDYKAQIGIKRDDEIGDLSRAFESMRDGIATRELEIGRLAYWDTLTNLPNRAQFTNLLNTALAHAKERQETCYVLMMDLDRFKTVNDVLGHTFGDALLRQVGERLERLLIEEADHVARLGGDEFVLLLPNIGIEQAKDLACRILKSFETPISLEDQTVDLGAGIGIAGFPDHGSDAAVLLSHAEVAMYAAKRSGNEAVVYDPVIDKGSQQSLSLLSELRHAIDNNEFKLYVQPKARLDTGEIIGLEALVRWMHPTKGLVFPDNFIPFAEKTGFIRILTLWVLDQSAALCSKLAEQDLYPKISVNLSARDLLDQELPAKFDRILTRHNVASSSFCLEITESAIMDDPIRAQQTLEALHAMHTELAIDDFGTGYSSLAYLKRLPVHELKIDKSFVMNMERDTDDATIVRSTIDLGHNMGLRVVAEGIENEAVWDILAKMGCDHGQGYFISRPMPLEQFARWMEKWTPPQCVLDTAVQA